MALYRRGRTYYADYYAYGKRVQESTGTVIKRDAEKFLALRLSEVQRRVFVKESATTLPEFWERYLEHAKARKRSWKRDVQLYNRLHSFFGDVQLRDVKPRRIEEYQEMRIREVAPATANRELALLKHMFFLAERWGMHAGNPVRAVRFLAENNLKFQTLSEDEERRLLEASPPYLREMIAFAIHTGLRTSEIFGLTWEEVDREQKALRLEVRKTRKELLLPLNETAWRIIEGRPRQARYVFPNPMTGERLVDVKNAFAKAVQKAGIAKCSWHTLRHTFASRLSRNGVDIVTVKELLGHSSISVTMRYAHTNTETKRKAVAGLDRDRLVTEPEKS